MRWHIVFIAGGFLAAAGLSRSGHAESVASSSSARPVDMQKSATLSLPEGTVLIGPEKSVCGAASEGALRYSVLHKTLMVCDGAAWKKVVLEPVKDTP